MKLMIKYGINVTEVYQKIQYNNISIHSGTETMCFWKCFSIKFQTDKANKRPDKGSSLAKIQPAILTMLDNYKLMSLTNFESN